MKVAVVHYHLKPGGVTRVIEHAAAALSKHDVQLVSLSGERYAGNQPLHTLCLPALAYSAGTASSDPLELAREMERAATQALGAPPDIWHIHNHSLGKNHAFPDALYRLAQKGARMLLQLHDFAEDGRPLNHARLHAHLSKPEHLYPYSSAIQYAMLNERDRQLLIKAGLPPTFAHLLPNPVTSPPKPSSEHRIHKLDTDNTVLYPTRAIRRKNLGELLLWAVLDQEQRTFATTATPANPEQQPIHDRWERFARDRELPVRLGLCNRDGLDFATLMHACPTMISTSVAEGFGLAFLEPWLTGKSLCGRNLPDITADFSQAGVSLDCLYEKLLIPADIFQKDALRNSIDKALKETYATYRTDLPEGATETALSSISEEGCVDFGGLDEALQMQAIDAIISDAGLRTQITPCQLSQASPDTITRNRENIEGHYSLHAYGEHLHQLYQKILNAPASKTDSIPPCLVLEAFLDPYRFRLLRT